jgi:hypothetical protein
MILLCGLIGPFVIVSTLIIKKEINNICKCVTDLKFYESKDKNISDKNVEAKFQYSEIKVENDIGSNTNGNERHAMKIKRGKVFTRTTCSSESDTKTFVAQFVQHHLKIKR